ncbi:MAG: LPP20 family lipoprotein [Treponema sp.]|nr:LPP20 family lipoprotein [Treponema sp.]
MKKLLTLAVIAITGFMFMSCGSTDTTSAAAQAADLNLPEWVLAGRKDDKGIYAVGSGKLSNLVNSQKMAIAQGRLELAATTKTSVQGITQTLVDDQGAEGDRQDLEALTENALLKVDNILVGSEKVDQYVAKDGTVYVLMFLPKETFLTELNKSLAETKAKSFNRTSSAAYTEAKMAEAYEKYFANNN